MPEPDINLDGLTDVDLRELAEELDGLCRLGQLGQVIDLTAHILARALPLLIQEIRNSKR